MDMFIIMAIRNYLMEILITEELELVLILLVLELGVFMGNGTLVILFQVFG